MIDVFAARQAVVEVCRSMYERGLLVAGDGNVSVHLGQHLLVTPTRSRKGHLHPSELVLCELDGTPLPGQTGRPSSELLMHLLAYRARPEIRAVVHAHPPYAVAHTIAGVSLAEPLVPEAYAELGAVPTVPYATPTTKEVPEALEGPIRRHDVLLLERHGSLTLGRTLEEAYDRLEVLEHTAKMSFLARQLGGGRVAPLDPAQLRALAALGGVAY